MMSSASSEIVPFLSADNNEIVYPFQHKQFRLYCCQNNTRSNNPQTWADEWRKKSSADKNCLLPYRCASSTGKLEFEVKKTLAEFGLNYSCGFDVSGNALPQTENSDKTVVAR